MTMLLSATKVVYRAILNTTSDLDPFSLQMDKEDLVLELAWAARSSCSHDFPNDNLPSYEAILEAMYDPNMPWDDMHQRSYFLP
jgi:hypothetical protein